MRDDRSLAAEMKARRALAERVFVQGATLRVMYDSRDQTRASIVYFLRERLSEDDMKRVLSAEDVVLTREDERLTDAHHISGPDAFLLMLHRFDEAMVICQGHIAAEYSQESS